MVFKRSYLSGATKRKQREARLENEAKTRQTLEDLNWCISTPKNNETDSELHKVSGDPESETSNISDLSDMAATPTTSKSLTENEESPTHQQISNMDNNVNHGSNLKNRMGMIVLTSSPTLQQVRTRSVLVILMTPHALVA